MAAASANMVTVCAAWKAIRLGIGRQMNGNMMDVANEGGDPSTWQLELQVEISLWVGCFAG